MVGSPASALRVSNTRPSTPKTAVAVASPTARAPETPPFMYDASKLQQVFVVCVCVTVRFFYNIHGCDVLLCVHVCVCKCVCVWFLYVSLCLS
jgi:hypothetical protein